MTGQAAQGKAEKQVENTFGGDKESRSKETCHRNNERGDRERSKGWAADTKNEHALKHINRLAIGSLSQEKYPEKRELKIPKDFSRHTFSCWISEGI